MNKQRMAIALALCTAAHGPSAAIGEQSWEQSARVSKTPHVELMDGDDVQYLEAFTAPGSLFHWSLCDPPQKSGGYLCTQLPLGYNRPFTQFPVALRFYDSADAKSTAQFSISDQRHGGIGIGNPHFFLLDMHHGKLVVTENGDELTYTPTGLDQIPIMKAGEHYRSSMALAMQSNGYLKLEQRVVVPKGTVLFRPIPLGMNETERKWRKCEGEIVPKRLPSGYMHQYASGGNCDATYTVNVFGERSGKDVTAYVFRKELNFTNRSNYQRLNQTYRISPKDHPGLYTLEWWYAGKILTRTRFEVKP